MKSIARKTAKSDKTLAPMMKASKATKRPSASHDAIAARAYELYLARGCADGQDEDDWLRAEADLTGG